MAKSKLIVICLNGGLSLGLNSNRTYMSTLMKRYLKKLRRRRRASKVRGIWAWARGWVFPTPTWMYRRSVKSCVKKIKKYAHPNNRLVMLGKSAGAHNLVDWCNDNRATVELYGYKSMILVDMNIGPSAQNRNGQSKSLDAKLDSALCYYTDDDRLGGMLLDYKNPPSKTYPTCIGVNWLLPKSDHFNCVENPEVKRAIYNELFYACGKNP